MSLLVLIQDRKPKLEFWWVFFFSSSFKMFKCLCCGKNLAFSVVKWSWMEWPRHWPRNWHAEAHSCSFWASALCPCPVLPPTPVWFPCLFLLIPYLNLEHRQYMGNHNCLKWIFHFSSFSSFPPSSSSSSSSVLSFAPPKYYMGFFSETVFLNHFTVLSCFNISDPSWGFTCTVNLKMWD